jgi:secretion/DNA translocation related CpaE-like protein
VHVIGRGTLPDRLFRCAVDLGAASVVELPAADRWLVSLLTDLGEDPERAAATVGVLGGSGGVGATVLAAALALTAARRGSAMLVDLDPYGPGLGTVCGSHSSTLTDGITWDDLQRSEGRLSARALREALPRLGGLGILGWPALVAGALPDALIRETLSAARRGHDWVVVDLARRVTEGRVDHASLCDHVLLVVGAQVAAVSSAVRLVASCDADSRFAAVVRSVRGAPPADQVAHAVGLPLVAELREWRRLEEQLALGLGPVHSARGPLARTAGEILDRLQGAGRRQATVSR